MQTPITSRQFEAAVHYIKGHKELKMERGDVGNADIDRSFWQGDYCHVYSKYGRLVAIIGRSDLMDALSQYNKEQVKKEADMNRRSLDAMNELKAVSPFSIQSSSLNGRGKYQKGHFTLSGVNKLLFNITDISRTEIITEAEAKNFLAKVGWGTAALIGLGTVFSGGLGLLGAGAALLATGNNKRISFLATLSSGEQYIITTSDKVYLEIKSFLLSPKPTALTPTPEALSREEDLSGCGSLLLLVLVPIALVSGGIYMLGLSANFFNFARFSFMSESDKILHCSRLKPSSSEFNAMNCKLYNKRQKYSEKGQKACIRWLTLLSGYQAEPAQTYELKGESIYRLWFVKDKVIGAKKADFSLAECRRDLADPLPLLQWREIASKGSPTPLSDWTVTDDRIYYDHPIDGCIGLSIAQCREHAASAKTKTQSPPRPTASSNEYLLEQRAVDEIKSFENWSGNGPAPQVIPAMEKHWRCQKYGDC
jgi:hypothetical protein